ncbi:hypothetical protein H5410_028093 [Solanum commersonii]|uniref:Uncharacterized protein n=1 Tax=Solanum commersonii TaxID=4109 RepID=A0A9J5Z135_SOLCO|nr:hypothetical protein H5410_028093 [Solanum commersonii]
MLNTVLRLVKIYDVEVFSKSSIMPRSFPIMSPLTPVRGHPAWKNVDPQDKKAPNALGMKPPQGDVTIVEFRNAI